MSRSPLALLAAAPFALMLAACADGRTLEPEAVPAEEAPTAPTLMVALECRADARAGTLSCEPQGAGTAGTTAGGPSRVILGGQNEYIRLTSSGVSFDGTHLNADVTVTNLLGQPLATLDGSTPHADGVRVFIHSGPTNGVTMDNADGTGTFTAAGQPYYQYSTLGGDGLLGTDEVGESKLWKFRMNGASRFDFVAYVSAEVPDANAMAKLRANLKLETITAGSNHTCALDTTGKAWCWGNAESGQLGNGVLGFGAKSARPDSVHGGYRWSSISAGAEFTCGVTTTGAGYCWGGGSRGTGSTTDVATPRAIAGATVWKQISAGMMHACGLSTAGTILCWGSDGNGELGDGVVNSPYWTDTPAPISGARSWEAVSAGGYHTCAISKGGAAYCWGYNYDGQLGNGSTAFSGLPTPQLVRGSHSWTSIDAGLIHTCGVSSLNRLYCWGRNNSGQVTGTPSSNLLTPQEVHSGTSWVQAAAGGGHSCAVDSSGSARCWGMNSSGQRGDGGADDGLVQGRHAWAQLSAGEHHTCGVTTDGVAYCWGDGTSGQVGDGMGDGISDWPSAVVAPASGAVTWRAP